MSLLDLLNAGRKEEAPPPQPAPPPGPVPVQPVPAQFLNQQELQLARELSVQQEKVLEQEGVAPDANAALAALRSEAPQAAQPEMDASKLKALEAARRLVEAQLSGKDKPNTRGEHYANGSDEGSRRRRDHSDVAVSSRARDVHGSGGPDTLGERSPVRDRDRSRRLGSDHRSSNHAEDDPRDMRSRGGDAVSSSRRARDGGAREDVGSSHLAAPASKRQRLEEPDEMDRFFAERNSTSYGRGSQRHPDVVDGSYRMDAHPPREMPRSYDEKRPGSARHDIDEVRPHQSRSSEHSRAEAGRPHPQQQSHQSTRDYLDEREREHRRPPPAVSSHRLDVDSGQSARRYDGDYGQQSEARAYASSSSRRDEHQHSESRAYGPSGSSRRDERRESVVGAAAPASRPVEPSRYERDEPSYPSSSSARRAEDRGGIGQGKTEDTRRPAETVGVASGYGERSSDGRGAGRGSGSYSGRHPEDERRESNGFATDRGHHYDMQSQDVLKTSMSSHERSSHRRGYDAVVNGRETSPGLGATVGRTPDARVRDARAPHDSAAHSGAAYRREVDDRGGNHSVAHGDPAQRRDGRSHAIGAIGSSKPEASSGRRTASPPRKAYPPPASTPAHGAPASRAVGSRDAAVKGQSYTNSHREEDRPRPSQRTSADLRAQLDALTAMPHTSSDRDTPNARPRDDRRRSPQAAQDDSRLTQPAPREERPEPGARPKATPRPSQRQAVAPIGAKVSDSAAPPRRDEVVRSDARDAAAHRPREPRENPVHLSAARTSAATPAVRSTGSRTLPVDEPRSRASLGPPTPAGRGRGDSQPRQDWQSRGRDAHSARDTKDVGMGRSVPSNGGRYHNSTYQSGKDARGDSRDPEPPHNNWNSWEDAAPTLRARAPLGNASVPEGGRCDLREKPRAPVGAIGAPHRRDTAAPAAASSRRRSRTRDSRNGVHDESYGRDSQQYCLRSRSREASKAPYSSYGYQQENAAYTGRRW